jgi:hypothetical protein
MGQIDYHGHTIVWTTKQIAPRRYAVLLIADGHNHGVQAIARDRKTVWRKGRKIAEWYWRTVIKEMVIAAAMERKHAAKPRQHVQPLKAWTPRDRATNMAILTKIAITVNGV